MWSLTKRTGKCLDANIGLAQPWLWDSKPMDEPPVEPTIAPHLDGEDLDGTDMVMAALLAALEERWPGVSNRTVEIAEDDAFHTEIRRLRGPIPGPTLAERVRAGIAKARVLRAAAVLHGAKPQPAPERPRRKRRDRA
jgi:hypothetical protein